MKKWSKKKKEYVKHRIALVSTITLLVLLLLTGAVSMYYTVSVKPTASMQRQSNRFISVDKPKIQSALLTPNHNSRPQIALETVTGIVVHYTANPGTDAWANRNYFEGRKNMPDQAKYKVSSHFIIGLDGTILQCIPLDEVAYASNKRNNDTISIECCHPGKNGKFSNETYRSLVQLTAYLCGKYGLEVETVIRHYDVTGKLCPLYYVKHKKAWQNFKTEVASELANYSLLESK